MKNEIVLFKARRAKPHLRTREEAMNIKIPTLMRVLAMAASIAIDASAADTSDIFGFGDIYGNPALFGIRLGQTISFDNAELVARYKLCTNGVAQWGCCGFTPEPEYRDPQFSRHRIFIDGASHQVVAVDAHFDSLCAPFRFTDQPSAQFTNLLQHAFNRYGQYETRLSDDCWQSGRIFWTTFFIPSGASIVISHHTQFGGELRLCRVSSSFHKRSGRVFPERYQEPSLQPSLLGNGGPFNGGLTHPALKLYEQYRSRRQSTIGILERHFAMSAAKLKSDKISQPVWENIVRRKKTGKFGSIVMNGKDSAWEIDAYINDTMAVLCHLRLFDSATETYDYGMSLLTNRLLPGDMLCDMFNLAETIPDICLVAPKLETIWDSRPAVILMRANGVFVCAFNGQSTNYAADAAWLLDFFKQESGTRQVDDSSGESIEIRKTK